MTISSRVALALVPSLISVSIGAAAHGQTLPQLEPADDVDSLTAKVVQITEIAAKQAAKDYDELGMWEMETKVKTCIAGAGKKPARSIYCVQYDNYATSYDRLVPPPLRLPFFAEANVLSRHAATLRASFEASSAEALAPMLTSIFVGNARTSQQPASAQPSPSDGADSPSPARSGSAVSSVRQFDDPPTVQLPDWVHQPTAEEVEGVYPTMAAVLHVPGRVDLSCSVPPSGALTDCTVDREVPTGFGFGQAALKLARFGKMRPKRVNGDPVTSKVRFSMPFDPK